MPKPVIVRYIGSLPGESHYEVHTPMGTWQVDMVQYSAGSYEGSGYGTAPRWMVTTPGEDRPDSEFQLKRDAVAYIATIVDEELDRTGGDAVQVAVKAHLHDELHADNSPWLKVAEQHTAPTAEETPAIEETDVVTESAPRFVVNQLGNGYFAVRDTVTDLDVATTTSRYAAQDKADRLEAPAAPRYITHSFTAGATAVFAVKDTETGIDVASFYSREAARDKRDRLNADLAARETREAQLEKEFPTDGPKCGHGFALRVGVTASVKCEFGHEYGVFGDEGPIDRSDCAMQAANGAAFYTAEDDGDTQYVVKVICPDHEDQPQDGCEECFTDQDADEDED